MCRLREPLWSCAQPSGREGIQIRLASFFFRPVRTVSMLSGFLNRRETALSSRKQRHGPSTGTPKAREQTIQAREAGEGVPRPSLDFARSYPASNLGATWAFFRADTCAHAKSSHARRSLYVVVQKPNQVCLANPSCEDGIYSPGCKRDDAQSILAWCL
jgi:hypothetical protein